MPDIGVSYGIGSNCSGAAVQSAAVAGRTGPALTAPANAVHVSPAAIQSAISSNGANTSFLLARGTYTDAAVTPKSGDAFYGEGQATWNGSGQAAAFNLGGTTHILISGITFTGFNTGIQSLTIRTTSNGAQGAKIAFLIFSG